MTQAIEEAIKAFDALPYNKPYADGLRQTLTTLYSQGRDAGVEECIEIAKKMVPSYGEDGEIQGHSPKNGIQIADELLKLKGTA